MKTTSFTGLCALTTLGLLAACDNKPPTAPPAPAATPAPSSTAASAPKTDWSKVVGVTGVDAVDGWSKLSRYVDAWYKGVGGPWTLSFSDGKVTDGSGHTGTIKAEQWKGVLDLIDKSPDKKTPVRTANDHSYADGLGTAKRFAYTVERTPDGKLVFTLVKPLDGESNG